MAKNQPVVSEAVKDMRANGTIDRLSNRWLGGSYQMAAEIANAEKP
ncbi:hypothetical protein [Variovorax sp. Varisp62]